MVVYKVYSNYHYLAGLPIVMKKYELRVYITEQLPLIRKSA